MGIVTGQTGEASDFINQSEKDATPANDADRVAKLESDGRFSGFFTRNGEILNCGETLNGDTTPVPVYQNKTDNELYACDANDATKYKFIGFVTSNGTNGNPANFQGNGIVSGFTGLDEGEKYYVQDTAGTIGTTPGTQEILVGVAISTTQLLIQKGRRYASGDGGSLGTASGSLVVTTGFRASKIRIVATAVKTNSDSHVSFTDAIWLNGIFKSATAGSSGGGISQLANIPIVFDLGSDYMTFSITSFSDTGFTINWTETGTFTPDASQFSWEAEGEL